MSFSHVTFLSYPKYLTLQTFRKNKNQPNKTPTKQPTKITPKNPKQQPPESGGCQHQDVCQQQSKLHFSLKLWSSTARMWICAETYSHLLQREEEALVSYKENRVTHPDTVGTAFIKSSCECLNLARPYRYMTLGENNLKVTWNQIICIWEAKLTIWTVASINAGKLTVNALWLLMTWNRATVDAFIVGQGFSAGNH